MRIFSHVVVAALVLLAAPPDKSGASPMVRGAVSPLLVPQAPQEDRRITAEYPQLITNQHVWGSINLGNGGDFQSISNLGLSFHEQRGMVTAYTAEFQTIGFSTANNLYPGRGLSGFAKFTLPSIGVSSPTTMAMGPNGVLHAVWCTADPIVDGFGQSTTAGYMVYRTLKDGVWSPPKLVSPKLPWIGFTSQIKMLVTPSGFAHIFCVGLALNPSPQSTHYQASFLAYTSSSGGYKVVHGTEADPLWIGNMGHDGNGDIGFFEARLVDESTAVVIWAGWFPNDTWGRTWGIHYHRVTPGGDMWPTTASLYRAAPAGSLTNHWGYDRSVFDTSGNDHIFYQYFGQGPMIHLVNNVQVETFDIPAGVQFGRYLGYDSRGQLHVIGLGWHWIRKTDGTWVYGPSSFTWTGYGQLIFGRNDQMFIEQGGNITTELSHTLGVRDPAGHTPVLPGGSVDLVTGNFHYALPLFSTKGVGPTQSMALYYNSMDNRSGYLPQGWRLNYEMYLTYLEKIWQGPDRMTLTMPDGRTIVFSGAYGTLFPEPEYGFSAVLECLNYGDRLNAQYRMTTNDGTQYLFGTTGKLSRITDPSGNYLELFYDGDGYLIEVRDMLGNGGPGRSSFIEYTAGADPRYPRRISRIVDPLGATYSLKYSGWNLVEVKVSGSSSSPTPTYSFEVASKTVRAGSYDILLEDLVSIRTPHGGKWELKYTADHRVNKAIDPDGKSKTIFYDESVAAGQPRKTFVTDRRGVVTEYTLDEKRSLMLKVKDQAYDPAKGIFEFERTYDADGQMLTEKDRWGKQTTFTWRGSSTPNQWARGLLLTMSRPAPTGTGQQLVLTNVWGGVNLGPTVITSTSTYATPTSSNTTPGTAATRTTTMAYADAAARHRPTRITPPTANLPDGSPPQTANSDCEYNGPRKQVSKAINEEGHWVEYSDFDSVTGLPKKILREGGSQHEELQYDIMGNVTNRRLPKGGPGNDSNTGVLFFYDQLGRLTLTNDSAGNMTTFAYNAASQVERVIPSVGAETKTVYDWLGRAVGGTTPEGSWFNKLDPEGNVLEATDIRGQTTKIKYDFLGRVIEAKVPGGSTVGGFGGGGPSVHVITYAYDQFDQLQAEYFSTTTEGSGGTSRVTKTTYDNRGRTKLVIAPDNQTKTEMVYDEQDQVVATQQLFGTTVQTASLHFRDSRDRVYQVRTQNSGYLTSPGQQSSTYAIYNKVGSVMKTVDPLGIVTNPSSKAHKIEYLRDARERVTGVIDGKGNLVRSMKYGDDDLLIEVKVPDPATKTTALVTAQTYEYTGRKEVKRTFDRNGAVTQVAYNLLPGEVSQVTDPLNRVTATTYHSQTRRPTQVVQAQGTADATTTNYVWANGLLTETKVFNPETGGTNASFKNYYDAAGRIERKEYPSVATGTAMAAEQYFYNEFGELRQTINGSRVTNHTYDSRGLLTGRSWSGPAQGSETRTYTDAGLPASVTNGIQTLQYTWHTWKGAPLDEIFSVGGQTWKVHTKTTDAANNVTALLDSENKLHEWPVDENNRPIEKRLSGQGVSAITYTPGGQINTETLKDGSGSPIARTIYSYDGLGRVAKSQTVKVSTNETLASYGYTYDAAGQVTNVSMDHLGATYSISSDSIGRIKTETTAGNNGGATAPPFTNTLVALSQGNESAATSETQATPNTRIAVPARSASYVYGASGNRTSQTVNGATTTYQYNALNQLTGETSPTQTVTYQYDEFGNQTQRVTAVAGGPTTTENFGYNHQNLMSVYTNSATGAAWQYEYQPTGERYAKTNLSTNASEIYVHDGWNVVSDYTKASGAAPVLQNTYSQGQGLDSKTMRLPAGGSRRYYLGNMVGTVGAVLDNAGTVVETSVRDAWGKLISGSSTERYGFAQRDHDSESGLVHMRHRMYDPRTGRFTQVDPIRGNRPGKHYAYASNKPITRIDPRGLDDTPDGHARILKHFVEWYGDAGLVLLNAFIQSGGTLDLTHRYWFQSDLSVGIREITVNADHEGSAAEDLLTGLMKSIGEFDITQKANIATALGIEGSELNLATFRSIARNAQFVLDCARTAGVIVNSGFAVASGIDRLSKGEYLAGALELVAGTAKLVSQVKAASGSTASVANGSAQAVTTVSRASGEVATVARELKTTTIPFPSDGVFTRVMGKKYAEAFAKGAGKLGGKDEVFIGAGEDMMGVKTIKEAQTKFALFRDKAGTTPSLDGDALITFRLRDTSKVTCPIEKLGGRGYGFTPGGHTGGGVREWVIQNGTAADLGAYDIHIQYLK
jgi:RHS repeat-associated protein